MPNILIIDDDDMMCTTLTTMVERKGYQASSCMTLKQGIVSAQQQDYDVVFLDVKMPDGNGLDALAKIEASPSAPEVIIMTGFGEASGAEMAIKSGAWDYIEKGFSVKEITLSLERALQYRQEKMSVCQAQKKVTLHRENIVGSSVSLNSCLDLVSQAANSDANVFITGETGTGKELFARSVHQNSSRSRGNFVVVDCTSLPETLVESLLFGHEKGAFTGANRAQDGLVRQAHCGTLFLDEVGELPLVLQKAFLRVLQEHRFRPLGSNREVESDFRLVAATNRNLDEMVEQGRFRSDLLFRLRSFILELPPLRERLEDIEALARFHTEKFCNRYGMPRKEFSPDFLEMLRSYPWPGNVREFVNTIERTLATARYELTLFPKHLPSQIRVKVAQSSLGTVADPGETVASGPVNRLPKLQEYRDAIYAQAEQQYLQDLMEVTDQDIQDACRISGLSQSRLYALLKKYTIQRNH